jgi:hypothetical protein
MTQAAVFIDRDGTLTEELGDANHPTRLRPRRAPFPAPPTWVADDLLDAVGRIIAERGP